MIQRYVLETLTHFVGRGLQSEQERYDLLLKILRDGFLSHPPHSRRVSGNLVRHGQGKISDGTMYSSQVVCFCDIPAVDLGLHVCKYSSFGLSFRKDFLVERGASPVFYVAANSKLLRPRRGQETRGELFDRLTPSVEDTLIRALQQPQVTGVDPHQMDVARFVGFQLLSFVKMFDASLPEDDSRNYYMEREWRILGNLQFALRDVHCVFLPRDYARRLRRDLPGYCGQLVFLDGNPASQRHGIMVGEQEGARPMKCFDRITIDPHQMGGVPCIRGLRIPVATVVGLVAEGRSDAEILADYPDLEQDDIRQALAYAAEAVRERQLPLQAG